MKTRRSFIAAVTSGSVAVSLGTVEPVAGAAPKPPSSQSEALARAMRARFDPQLSAADLQTIAKAIDANNDAALALNPKKKRLKNGDAPALRFAVADGDG